ncbi:MAG TPA: helix-turn-helix domain-containing protein [Pyrinomonadaceae bacterium]|jgi:transcriptional regulator with GAF, ATPase, and Fis domain
MHGNGKASVLEKSALSFEINQSSSAVTDNRLEALRVLSNSLVKEIEALRKGKTVLVPAKINLIEEVQRFEKELIRCALVRTGGKQRQAARLLNVKVSTLNMKIKRYGINSNGLYQESELEMPF